MQTLLPAVFLIVLNLGIAKIWFEESLIYTWLRAGLFKQGHTNLLSFLFELLLAVVIGMAVVGSLIFVGAIAGPLVVAAFALLGAVLHETWQGTLLGSLMIMVAVNFLIALVVIVQRDRVQHAPEYPIKPVQVWPDMSWLNDRLSRWTGRLRAAWRWLES